MNAKLICRTRINQIFNNSLAMFWIVVIAFSLIFVLGYFFADITQKHGEQNARDGLIKLVNLAAANIHPSRISSLKATPEDLENDGHLYVKNQLKKIKQSSKDYKFVYLMKKTNDKIVFLVDAEKQGSDDYSPPGQVYHEASESLIKIFSNGQSFIEGPIVDDWGKWISAHAAIRDSHSEKVIAIIGLDIDAAVWERSIAIYRWGSYGITSLLFILVSVFLFTLKRICNLNDQLKVSSEKLRGTINDLTWANDELDAFSYSVSHDLRAPIRRISGFAQLLKDENSGVVESGDYLSRIKASTDDMNNMIDAYIDLSKSGKQAINKKDINITEMVKQIIEEQKIEGISYATISFEVHDGMEAKADELLLRTVYVNLISNAIKYSRQNQTPRIEIGRKKESNKFVFFIKDNGVGFNSKFYDGLFKPLQRLHSKKEFEGLGIGLSIVARIISRHGGEIWAESEPDKETSFYFTLE